jgi:hypothetical protein
MLFETVKLPPIAALPVIVRFPVAGFTLRLVVFTYPL